MEQDKLPQRIHLALELLAPLAGDRLLELGCGPGIAAIGCAQRTEVASYLGIDRSPTAISRARKAVSTSGLPDARRSRLAFRQAAVAAFNPGAMKFDRIFAINLNLFWLDAGRELAAIKGCLTRRGRLLLFFEPPVAAKSRRIVAGCEAQLAAGGFAVVDIHELRGGVAPFIAIAAAPTGAR